MKKIAALFLSLTFALVGCTGQVGSTGPQGEPGEDGLDGQDGKSAYELYCEEHPEYKGTLEEWLEDLANGNLSTVYHMVSFETGTGRQIEPQEVKHLGKASKPADPERKGYTFNCWTYQGEPWSFIGYVVTEDMTLNADWEANTYHVTFNPMGGELDNIEAYYTFDDEVVLPIPVKDEATFLGWTHEGAVIENGPWLIAEDCTLIATWRQNSYKVEYDFGYDDLSSSENIPYGEYLHLPSPEREGYEFLGWLNEEGEAVTSQDYLWLHDLKLTAAWKAAETTVTLDPGEGHLEEAKVVLAYDQDFELPVPTGTEDPFSGWYCDGLQITDEYGKGLSSWSLAYPSLTLEASYCHLIHNEYELCSIADDPSGHYRLANDIALVNEWRPIGTEQSPFTGVFDGNGYSISGLTITEPNDNYLGLFGYLDGAFALNVKLVKAKIDVSFPLSNENPVYVGLLAGYVASAEPFMGISVDNQSVVNVELIGDNTSHIGGLIGRAEGFVSFDDSTNAADVKGNCDFVGGLIGYSNAAVGINASGNSGDIYGINDVGGLIGSPHSSGVVESSFNQGNITGTGNSVGGMIGNSYSKFTFIDSFNSGVINGASIVGGFAGALKEAEFNRCANRANVTGSSSAGGFVGMSSTNAILSFENSHNSGAINGANNVGGFLGYLISSIGVSVKSCSNSGSVAGAFYVGGFIGSIYSSSKNAIYASTNFGAVKGTSGVGGIAGATLLSTLEIDSSGNYGNVYGSSQIGGLVGFASFDQATVSVKNSLVACKIEFVDKSAAIGPFYGMGEVSALLNSYYLCDFVDSSGNGYKGDNNLDGLSLNSVDQITEEFFSDTLGWDLSLWDFSNFDPTNGVFPVPTGLPSFSNELNS